MKLKFERTRPQERDIVLIEPDGTVFTSFMKTGYMNAAARTRFASGQSAATGAFSTSEAEEKVGVESTARHGLVFCSEIDGQEKIALIERFSTGEEAQAALSLVQGAVRRHVIAQRRKNAWRMILRYAGGPFLIFTVAMSGVRYLDSHNGSLEALNSLVRAAQASGSSPLGLPSGSPAASTAAAPEQNATIAPLAGLSQRQMAGPADLSSPAPAVVALASARAPDVAGAMTSIHFGLENQPRERTLYVYSDPNCPACRRFEPHLNDLAKDFSIYVFPVAYQDGSAKLAEQIMCAPDRKQKWEGIMNTMKPGDTVTGNTCARAADGIRANMQAFDALGFNSTPRVVSGTGFVFAEGATASIIRKQSAGKQG